MLSVAKRLALGTQALFAVLALPPELVTFEKIADELRVPVATKIRDMRSNYGLRETAPGNAWAFVEDGGEPQLTIRRTKTLSASRDSYHENVQFTSFGSVLYEETIDIRGNNLSETDLDQRLLFDSTSGYGLQSDAATGLDETEKTVQITVGKAPVLRYALRKSEKDGTRTTVIELATGGQPVLRITDAATQEPALRTYTYTVLSESYVVRMMNNAMQVFGLPVAGTFQVRVEKPAGFARAQTTYQVNGQKYYSFDGFMNEFNSGIFEKFVTAGNLATFNSHVSEEFPYTERRQNAALGGKLLEELTQIFTKLQSPNLNPADQILIRNRILGYMDAVRDGSITDRRKGGN